MMEQLAERRMAREEEAQYAASGLGQSQHTYTNHPPDEDDFEDDDEDEYDSQEDYEEEDDEMVRCLGRLLQALLIIYRNP